MKLSFANDGSTLRRYPFLSAYALVLFGFLYVPLFLLALSSVQGGPTLWHWYERALADIELLSALENSLIIGAGTTLFATTLGTLTALATRKKFKYGARFIDALLSLPLVLPEIVMGLSMLVWFSTLQMTLGKFSVMLAHTTFCLPYVIMLVTSRLRQMDPLLEEAAADLGATPWTIFFKITLPLMLPAVVSAALLAFTLSFDDFLITFFTGGIGSDTLPLRIYSMMRFGVRPEVNAISTLVLLFTFVTVFLVGKLKQD